MERGQLLLTAFGKPLLEQGFDADHMLSVPADAFICHVDAVAVGVDLDTGLADIALDLADADGSLDVAVVFAVIGEPGNAFVSAVPSTRSA